MVGRESGEIRLQVCHRSDRARLQACVEQHTRPTVTVNTDEGRADDRLAATGRAHPTLSHTPGQRPCARRQW
ncbi:MAG: hypothetical protein M3380_02960 [Chloroflexota bacterium]|nr:hypothetical protein [Chloroflexota bacterium]